MQQRIAVKDLSTGGDMDDTREGGLEWSVILLSVVLTLAVLRALALLTRKRGSRLPPGPRGWPVFGSLLSLSIFPARSLRKLSRKYGPLMFMHLGSVPTLVINSPEMAKEIFKTHDHVMSSRMSAFASDTFTYNRQDLTFSVYGQRWRALRRMCVEGLFTANRLAQFQGMRHRIVMELVHSILKKSERGEAANMIDSFSTLSVNNIFQMMMNKRFSFDNLEAAVTLAKISKDMLVLLGAFNIGDFVPILRPFDLQGYNKQITDTFHKMDAFVESLIEEHHQKQTMPSEGDQDFIDVLFQVRKEERLSIETIKGILTDMTVAGIDTSAATLHWTLTELIKNPQVMKRAQEELDAVVGRDRLVEEADIPNLPYLQAVVKEGFRRHTPSPLLVPHVSIEDCEIAGYHIPGGTQILVNMQSIHTDPDVWKRPLEFDPTRFLNSSMDVKGQDFEVLPFGSGRRICPGMPLALILVHFALAQLLHVVSWQLPDGQKPEELDLTDAPGSVCGRSTPLMAFAKPRLSTHVIYPAEPPLSFRKSVYKASEIEDFTVL